MMPTREWEAVREEDPGWRLSLFRHALPLALLPALGWATGVAFNTATDPRVVGDWHGFALSALQTLGLSLISVATFALGLYLLSRMYDLRPDWNRAMAVAAFGSTPVFLTGVLLVVPILVIVSMVALLHCFFLYYSGAIRLLGCRPQEAAGFVALTCSFTVIVSAIIGALGSALGLL